MDENPSPSNYKTLEREAVREYVTQTAVEKERLAGNLKKRPFYTTALKCFCTFEKSHKDFDITREYSIPEDPNGGTIPVC